MTGDSSGQVRKTRSITFRIDAEVVDKLQTESDNHEVTLNVLVNQVLRRYTDWDTYETRIGMMPVPKLLLVSLIEMAISIAQREGLKDVERYRNEIIKEAAKIAFKLMKESVLFMKNKYSLWVVLAVLEEYMKVSGIKSDHRVEPGSRHVFVIQHDLGDNWSLFTKELLAMIFENLANVRPEIQVTTNTVIASLVL
ncbi:MAG: hypothetical protein ABI347_01765 [Nitrososphaera sp.]